MTFAAAYLTANLSRRFDPVNSFSKPLKSILSEAGWRFLRSGRGDHEIWHDPQSGRKVVVDNSMKSRHTANAVLKQAGLPKAF